MEQFKFIKLKTESTESGHITTTFLMQGLKPGQGLTIGNSIRRVLLSEIKGISITGIQIDDTAHEFSTVDGIREDILEIFLNLKQIVFKTPNTVPNDLWGQITINGPGIITASNIVTTPYLDIVNPNAYIATLTTKKELTINLKLEYDNGYRFGDQNTLTTNNFLALDAVFMPVLNVNYDLKVDYKGPHDSSESLILTVKTNGSLSPSQALNESCNYLLRLFESLTNKEKLIVHEEEPVESVNETVLIEELQLPARAYNCFKRVGINSLEDLKQYSEEEIREIKNFGKKSAQEVFHLLKEKYNIVLPTVKTSN